MTSSGPAIFVLIVGSAIGALLGVGFSPCLRPRSLGFGAAMAGLTFGTFLGLSSSPVLGAAVAAVSTLFGTYLGILGARTGSKPLIGNFVEIVTSLPVVGSESSQNTAALSTSQVSLLWLTPFATTLLAGGLIGVVIRANDLLNFSPSSLKLDLIKNGFSEYQAKEILNRRFELATGRLTNLRQQYRALGFTDAEIEQIIKRQVTTIILDPLASHDTPQLAATRPGPLTSLTAPPRDTVPPSSMFSGPPGGTLSVRLFTQINGLPKKLDDMSSRAKDEQAREWLPLVRSALWVVGNVQADDAPRLSTDQVELLTLYRQYLAELLDSKATEASLGERSTNTSLIDIRERIEKRQHVELIKTK